MTHPRPTVAALLLAAGLLVAAAPHARAQVSELDQSMLIDAMAEERMTELLLHLIETEPPDDPVVARQVEIAQYRMAFDDVELPREQRLAAFDDAVATTQAMIDDFYDHEQRPIWQTDLAELLLIPALQSVHQGAPFFYEFGVPTAEQRQAVERLVPLALEAASDADQTFFRLQSELPREDDHVRTRVNTGLWSRMIDDYYRKRTQYFLGQAAYQVALLPDDHPYYAQLGEPNPRIRMQRDEPEAERERLLLEVDERLTRFTDGSHESGIQLIAQSFVARALMRQEAFEEAEEAYTAALRVGGEGVDDLIIRLGQAENSLQQEDYAQASERALALEEHAVARQNPLYRLLVTDMQHRVLLAEAAQAPEAHRAAARAEAYRPYMEMLEDPALGDAAEGLRHYVYRRWVDTFADERDDLASLSPVVLAGIAEAARREGQNLSVELREAEAAAENGDAEGNDLEALRERAQARLNLAVEAGRALRTSDEAANAPASALATAMYNEAIAMYWLDPQGASNLMRVSKLMVDLAAEMPDQPVSEPAIANAMGLLRSLRDLDQRPAEVDQTYRRAGEVLFREYPNSEAADDERIYYGYEMLYDDGQYEAAAAMFGQVPFEHPDYFEAQAAMVMALGRHVQGLEEDDREAGRARTVEVATRVREEAESALDEADDAHRTQTARIAAAESRLVLARMAMDIGDADEALAVLDGFVETFADEDVLVREAMERRILALAQAGRLDEAADVAERMMEQFRDDAAAVIDEVLDTIDEQIEQYTEDLGATTVSSRRQDLEQRIDGLADTAVSLADLLYAWAQEQGLSNREMLSFELARAKAWRLAGQADEAVQLLEPRLEAFDKNAPLMHELAESLFAQGSEPSLRRAAQLYDQLIRGVEPQTSLWWNAWMRRLQVNDRLDQSTDAIPLRIRQLRRNDESLGGPRYRETFERLEARHQTR
ncbi:MAG: hypothetical protein WDZ31_01815 [Phycisphaeraceae bacterium]